MVLAGRTDRGVHAVGQVVGCEDRRPHRSEGVLRSALEARLPDDLAVLAVERREGSFHARYDARWREYRYRIWSGVRQPLLRDRVWQRTAVLDPKAMADAAARLVGTHDFASFAGGGDGVPWSARRESPRGTVRTVFRCGCREVPRWWSGGAAASGRLLELRIVADGFLPHMVRNLVSAFVEVGRGERAVVWIDEVMAARDRRVAPGTAPPHGLVLWRVGYGNDDPDAAPDAEPEEVASE